MPSAFIHQNMKKKRITYGVYGMMEYQAIIKIGRASLKVLFTDGSITALGQNPAQYTTSDFLVQHAIENSSDFKRGRITVVSAVELDDEVRIECNPTKASIQQASSPTEEKPVVDGADKPTEEIQTEESETITDEPTEKGPTEEAATEAGNDKIELEFDTNADAKEYLQKNFGVKSGSMKTRADIVAVGKTYGVEITFTS